MFDEGRSRHECFNQRGPKAKIDAGDGGAVVQRRGGLLKSAATEGELFAVMDRPYFAALIDPETGDWLKKMMAAAELVEIGERIIACRDPADDKFLDLAVNGHADVVEW